jgi:hypothetical protein
MFCPFLRSYWSLEFNAQIAGNGISGVLIFKIFWRGMPPDPPRKPRDFVTRSMTKNFGLATPLATTEGPTRPVVVGQTQLVEVGPMQPVVVFPPVLPCSELCGILQ